MMRIVSLLPSATEIVCALGLHDRLVGVTHECDHPALVAAKPKVTITHIPTDAASAEIDRLVRQELEGRGSLYALNFERLEMLRPDLIISQTLCDVCAVSDRAVRDAASRMPGAPTVVRLEPRCLFDVLDNIRTVASAAGVAERADAVVGALRARIQAVQNRSAWLAREEKVLVLEWLDPPFSSGHWTPELVRLAGGVEPLAVAGERSRELSYDEIAAADPDMLFVACCGYSVDRTLDDVPAFLARPAIAALRCVRLGRVYVTDGAAYFSRPGPRLIDSLEILAHAIDAERHPLPAGLLAARRITGVC